MNACVDACVERGRGRRAGAHPDAGTSRGRGSGGWAVGCLLSAALTGGGTAVKAAGGARPCDAVQTCAHPARDQPISRGTSTPLRRACFGPAGPDRACYGGKARRRGNGANEGGSQRSSAGRAIEREGGHTKARPDGTPSAERPISARIPPAAPSDGCGRGQAAPIGPGSEECTVRRSISRSGRLLLRAAGERFPFRRLYVAR